MPELPEVEVVRRGLADHAVGRTVGAVELRGPRVARRHEAGPADLAARLHGAQLLAADRRGKYLWLVTRTPGDDPRALVVHLGMSGQMLVSPLGAPEPKHLHAVLRLGETELRFVDQRTFGGLALEPLVTDPHGSDRPHGVPAAVAHIAPDPLEPAFDLAPVVARARRRRSGIKRVLLDQGVVSGIGNIYADEALWRARIHGEQPASTLSAAALKRLLVHAREVMSEALDQGGTSFDALYVNVNGQSGYFSRSLNVYGQAGKPCARCGAAIVRESFMNRGSHFCPRCQRLR